MKVNFIEVGANKKSWSAETEELTEEWLYEQARTALNSRIIKFYVNGDAGNIVVGGMRLVGRFLVSKNSW